MNARAIGGSVRSGELRRAAWVLGGLLALTAVSCDEPRVERETSGETLPGPAAQSRSRDAKLPTVEMLREDLRAPRHPSDGGGRAWLEQPQPRPGASRPQLRAGSRHRFVLQFEVGPLGIAEGGAVFLQPSPFWGWDSPQTQWADGRGYTEVRSEAPGVELVARAAGEPLLEIRVKGRRLEAGERIEIVYGAGPAGAAVDRHAERTEHIWIAVDGDGDGVRSLLQESPVVDVVAGPAAQLIVTLPSVARPGQPFELTLALLDALGNAGPAFEGEVVWEDRPEALELPERIAFVYGDHGRRTLEAVVAREGIFRLRARAVPRPEAKTAAGPGLQAESNPMVASTSAPRILWADLHGHSQLSDGTGTPDEYFRYARDVAGLDAAALTDHDHWGLRFLDQSPELWQQIQTAVRNFHQPGRFVTVLGYEWTSWLHGHRHVLYFGDTGTVWSSVDPETENPAQLWAALAGSPALTFAHHSAGGPISTNWDYVPDPAIEPVTEIVSVHGSSEARDSPGSIYNPVEGNFVRDVLDRGLRFGFIGSGDSHDGHPGLAQLASASGGLAAVFSEQRTREGLLSSLRARRCYATNGPRIWMRFALDGQPMGTLHTATEGTGMQQLDIAVVAPDPIERLDLVRSGVGVRSIDTEGQREWSGLLEIPALTAGEYLYLRVVQENGGAAWSSPFYAE